MQLKKEFITQMIGDKQMMVAVGESANNFSGIVKSNETAAWIVDHLKSETSEEELVGLLLEEYEVDKATAAADIHGVIQKLHSIGAIE